MSSRPAVAEPDPIRLAANDLARSNDTDVFLYNSGIKRPWDDPIFESCCTRRRRKNITLFLVTEGGDPDAAYRIARCFQEQYEKLTCVVPGYCKSAGTLILTGAHELVIGDAGELGPLDVQMTKKDELWETESGLTVMSALDALREKSFTVFENFFLKVKERSDNSVTFKTAAELAVKLTAGLFTPIYQQVDPIHVGEASRAQSIGWHYAARLSLSGRNITENSLQKLISGYPAHGFVIDRAEAETLFSTVRKPNDREDSLIKALGEKGYEPLRKEQSIREFISDEKEVENVTANTPIDSEARPGLRAVASIAGESA